jgi:hypothetical protein
MHQPTYRLVVSFDAMLIICRRFRCSSVTGGGV